MSEKEFAERVRWEVVWNVIVLAVAAVLLLPFGRGGVLWELVRAFAVLWGVLLMAAGLVQIIQRVLRVEEDPPSDAYVLSNLAVGVVLLVIFTGYVTLLLRGSAGGAPVWMMVILLVIGLLSSHAGYGIVSAVYGGTLYRTVNLAVALGGFVLFAAWPAAARAAFGWLT
jgi:hypothetical protein